MRALDLARQRGQLGDLDVHFARAVGAWGGGGKRGESPPVLLAAALLSQLVAAGHVCLDLAALAGQPLFGNLTAAPPLEEWQDALRSHDACGTAAAYAPLVLDGHRLYMRRYYDYECAVAAAWHARHTATAGTVPAQGLARLFPPQHDEQGDDRRRDQRAAAAFALQRNLSLISGGPGTGKTTTLASILALLVEQSAAALPASRSLFEAEPGPPRILLAAPTGKAAARMQEAIRGAKARLPVGSTVREAIPETALTLHRLLGAQPRDGGMHWRHGADNPLDCDVLVVDEASMIDMALMARLLAALPAHARLIMLGDRDQLASVDAGAVFADMCAAEAASLNISFRFDSGSDIGRLAAALRGGDADAALAIMRDTSDEVYWARAEESVAATRAAVVAHAADHYARFVAHATYVPGADVFAAFSGFRLLTPLRQGSLGVAALNAEIEKRLAALGAIPPRCLWYPGKPVMIAANDYALRLFNGDIGICVLDPGSGELRVAFPGEGEGAGGERAAMRLLAPARLPAHETAWCMTVHKSQGSEFDQVALVLPEEQGELITRELIYTAITRARQAVAVWAGEEALRAACARRIVRHSGLVDRLLRVA